MHCNNPVGWTWNKGAVWDKMYSFFKWLCYLVNMRQAVSSQGVGSIPGSGI